MSDDFDWKTLPCGFRVVDLDSTRSQTTISRLPYSMGIEGLVALMKVDPAAEFTSGVRTIQREHADHQPGACDSLPPYGK